jgi:hypothetical protein
MSEEQLVRGKLVFVMGGGKFGTNALRYLKTKGAKVLVADLNLECRASSEADVLAADLSVLDSLGDGQAAFLVGDAVNLLVVLLETRVPDMVVTAIPGNAVAKVVEAWLAERGVKLEPYLEVIPKVLENIPESLVSFIDYICGVIVVSYMPSDMKCRENCMPPKNVCASTGRPKLASMDKLLRFSVYNLTDVSGIFSSPQLTGGLGAINGNEFSSLLKRLANIKKPYTLAIGTACDCHGILRLIKIKK